MKPIIFGTIIAGLLSTSAIAHHAAFDVVNNSGLTVVAVFSTAVENRSFGQDLLGPSTYVFPGNVIRVDPGHNRQICYFDVAVRFETGAVTSVRNVNLCAANSVTVNPAGSLTVR